jgi:hypothetical protein
MSIRGAFAPRLRCRRMGAAVCMVMLVGAARARADESARRSVEVSSPTCKAGYLPMVSFLDSLRVELAGRALACCTVVEPGKETGTAVYVAIELVPCVPDGDQVQVAVHDRGSGTATERDVSLADVAASARPRALALAVAELIRALAQPSPPEPPPSKATPEEAPPPVTTVERAVASMHFEGELRALPTRDTAMWGGRVRLSAPWHRLHADLDLGGGFASAHPELGDVLMRMASVGLTVGPRLANGIAIVDLGLRAEVGWAWIHGETARPGVRTQAGSEWISCAGLRGTLQLPAASSLRPSLGVEGGFILRGAKGESNNQSVVGLTGYYLLAALGLAVAL